MANDWLAWRWAALGMVAALPVFAQVPGTQDSDPRTLMAQAATRGTTSRAAEPCHGGGSGQGTHKIPAELATQVNAAFNSRMTPAQAVASTVYRCIGARVAVCTTGANLNCGKADQSRTPGPGAVNWCRSHPDADFVPMFASGHATVYDWSCRGGVPQVGRQLQTVDSQGYVAENWKLLSGE